MSTLDDKIARAQDVIRRVLNVYKNPVVMSSFGKDSMVVLWILREMGHKFPVLCHREPFFPSKYEFADRIIRQENYTVYDYPPSAVTMSKANGSIEMVRWYSVKDKYLMNPIDILPPDPSKPFLCGFQDIYNRPVINRFEFPWDLAFMGHKNSDIDALRGAVPLAVDLKKNPGAVDYVYPLRHFTDHDIWDYSFRFSVPQNGARYEAHKIEADNDKFHACTACMDRDNGPVVNCPLLHGQQITNISKSIRYTEVEVPSYMTGVEAKAAN